MEILLTDKKSNGVNTKEYLVIHHTGSPNYESMRLLLSGPYRKGVRNVSVHYVVGQSGEVSKIGSHDDILWHAGMGKLSDNETPKNMNPYCIGIEVCSNGKDYTEIQRKTVDKLILNISRGESIKKRNIIRHADISGYRGKWDIGPNFYQGFETFPEYIDYIFRNNTTVQEEKDEKIKATFRALCSSSWYSASEELRVLIEETKSNFE